VAAFADRVVALAGGQIVADGPPRVALADPLMEEIGVGATRYTRAARLAQARGLVPPDRPLPVTLDQAVEFFR
jgi:ABC-type hemin transport system ATPase subunit